MQPRPRARRGRQTRPNLQHETVGAYILGLIARLRLGARHNLGSRRGAGEMILAQTPGA